MTITLSDELKQMLAAAVADGYKAGRRDTMRGAVTVLRETAALYRKRGGDREAAALEMTATAFEDEARKHGDGDTTP